MAIHHLRKWSLKYKVREETSKSYNKTLRSLFLSSYHFLDDDETLHYLDKKESEWLSTYSLQVDFGFFKIRIRLVNRKKVFFDFLMKLDEGFPTSLDLDSWCFAVYDGRSHLFCDMFAKECLCPKSSTIRRRLLSKFLLRFSRFYHLEESAIRPKVSAHMIRTFPRWYKGPIRP